MKKLFLLCALLYLNTELAAQYKLISGLWEGVLTYRNQEYTFEMDLKVKPNGKISGYSSVHVSDQKRIEMTLKGKLHMDRSMNVYEFKVLDEEGMKEFPWYRRSYQLVFRRSLWEMTLNGYWQELIPELLDEKSKIGRVFMKKGVDKAKP